MFDHLLYCISFLVVDLWCHQTWFKWIKKSEVAHFCVGSSAASKRFPTIHILGIHKLLLSTTHKWIIWRILKCFWQPSFVPENLSLQMKQKLNLSLKTQGRVIARCTCQYGYLSRCQALKSTLFKFLSLLAASFKPYCCPSFLDRQLYDQDWQVFSTLIHYRPSCIEY